MKVKRTEQIYIGKDENISRLCHLSKNLYNQTNYILRNQFINHEKMTGYNKLEKQFSIPSDIEKYNNYQKLPVTYGFQTCIFFIEELVYGFEYTAPDSNPL